MLSQASKDAPNSAVSEWMRTVDRDDTYLSAITFAELRRGIDWLPSGIRRRRLDIWLSEGVAVAYRGRIFPVDEAVADMAGRISAEARRIGWNIQMADELIAATARVHGLVLATLNQRHFKPLGAEMVEF